MIAEGRNTLHAFRLRFRVPSIARRPGKWISPQSSLRLAFPILRGHPATPRCAARPFSSSLAAAFLPAYRTVKVASLPPRQRASPSSGTADRPLLSARPRLSTPGAGKRPLPERNTHSFPSSGDNGTALTVMQIAFTSEEPPYRTGTLTGLTRLEVQRMLPGIQPDTRPSANHKISLMWRFLAAGKLCGVRPGYELRSEFSTFGPDAAFETLFGKAYKSLQT